MLGAGVPASPINMIDRLVTDPHIAGAREMFVDVGHPVAGTTKLTGSHIKLGATPVRISAPAPLLGQHNEAIFAGLLGIRGERLASLRKCRHHLILSSPHSSLGAAMAGPPCAVVARLPDGRIASGDTNNALRVWSLASGRVERTLQEGDSGIGSGPDGLIVLSDGRIVAGDPRRQQPLVIEPASGASSRIDLGGPTAWSTVLGPIHDGQVLLADSRLLVSRWNPATGTSLLLVDFSADEIGVDCALSLSPTRLLLGRRDGTLQLWSIG